MGHALGHCVSWAGSLFSRLGLKSRLNHSVSEIPWLCMYSGQAMAFVRSGIFERASLSWVTLSGGQDCCTLFTMVLWLYWTPATQPRSQTVTKRVRKVIISLIHPFAWISGIPESCPDSPFLFSFFSEYLRCTSWAQGPYEVTLWHPPPSPLLLWVPAMHISSGSQFLGEASHFLQGPFAGSAETAASVLPNFTSER